MSASSNLLHTFSRHHRREVARSVKPQLRHAKLRQLGGGRIVGRVPRQSARELQGSFDAAI
jgi:hypothetical protein